MLRTGQSIHPASNPASRQRTGASLPGTLASPRTGLSPAGCAELVKQIPNLPFLLIERRSVLSAHEHMFVRWSNLTLGEDEQQRLPGYRDEAIVRRFDAPEALETRFYEVQARSVLNRVPDKSSMPFRWTINPYRGCTHACTYCMAGDTSILMADGRNKPQDEVRVGDAIYGTVREGVYRRFAVTRVLAHWSSIKPAFRVTLEDGTELTASADHRFLTPRGWKHVTGSQQGRLRRPHLTLTSK